MADILTREADLIKNAEGENVARLEANKIILEDGAGGGSSYSIEEKKIGKWIDGKDVYQVVIVSTTPYTTGTFISIADVSDLHIADLVSLNLIHNLDVNGEKVTFPAPYIHNNSTHISVYLNGDSIDFYCDNRDWREYFQNNVIILQYTKEE